MRQRPAWQGPGLSLGLPSWAGHFAVSLVPENGAALSGWISLQAALGRGSDSGSPLDVESSLAHSASGSPLGSCVPQRKAPSRPLPLKAFLCSVQRLRTCLESCRCFSFRLHSVSRSPVNMLNEHAPLLKLSVALLCLQRHQTPLQIHSVEGGWEWGWGGGWGGGAWSQSLPRRECHSGSWRNKGASRARCLTLLFFKGPPA